MFLKDPGARLDYRFDWSERVADGRAITASDWLVEPQTAAGLVIESAAIDGATTVVWLAGGEQGRVYAVRNRVALSDGQIDERSLIVRVEQR
ncbi:phage fiber-tail adaptor protein [Thermaurantiacus sp.]